MKDEYLDLITQFPVTDGQVLLDVSVGTGNVNLAIQAVYPDVDLKLAGVDLSIGFLTIAKRKFLSAGIDSLLMHSQVHTLPFADEIFDFVPILEGLTHFQTSLVRS